MNQRKAQAVAEPMVPSEERLKALNDLMPDAFTEGRLDVEKLRASLGDFVETRTERYTFSWNGRRDAMRILQSPSRATLVPAPGEGVNEDATENLFIEGDNLEVLRLLLKPYFGRVKMIYIDPPYNTGKDFVYADNWSDSLQPYLRASGQKDEKGNVLTTNTETGGRFHSAWLSMLYPRLFVARSLLRDDGLIFVSIDDNEIHHLRLLLSEIFGEENFICQFVWQKKHTRANDAQFVSDNHEYILCYAKAKAKGLVTRLARTDKANSTYSNPDNDPRGDWTSEPLQVKTPSPDYVYEITTPAGRKVLPPEGRSWAFGPARYAELVADNQIWFGEDGSNVPRRKKFLTEVGNLVPITLLLRTEVGDNQEGKSEFKDLFSGTAWTFDNPKPTRLIRNLMQMAMKPSESDILLDFFAGSGSSAHAVLAANAEDDGNRRFILVQLPEPTSQPPIPPAKAPATIADLSKERVRRVLANLRKAAKSQLPKDGPPPDLGFKVFKLAESHIRPWEPPGERDGEKWVGQMALYEDPLKPGWKPLDVVWELALRELPYALNTTIEQLPEGNTWKVTDEAEGGSFTVNLDDTLKPEVVEALNLTKQTRFICRDIALTDEQAANLALQCDLRTL